jgi:glycosyltransferase involved in cell wall biosynthesis
MLESPPALSLVDTSLTPPSSRLPRRLVIVVRADPAICGHSGEARNLAEAAIAAGVDEVIILTWPVEVLAAAGIPLKPLDSILPYSPGITVERPDPVGDYKVPDGRHCAGIRGRLIELFSDGVPTVAMSLYLSPHMTLVDEALHAARAMGRGQHVWTIAEAVGSDITNVVRSCVAEGRFGPAAYLLATYLRSDRPVAVSDYTVTLIADAAAEVDLAMGTDFADLCRERVKVSYPAVNAEAFVDVDPAAVDQVLERRGLARGGFILFLSRLAEAKGVDDLIEAYRASRASDAVSLVIAGTGPALDQLRAQAGDDPRIQFLTDVDDAEKPALMSACAAYALPSKPRAEFVETFGIALVEKMLSGGGPVITTSTGGIPEAVGDAALRFPAGDRRALAEALDTAVLDLDELELLAMADAARRQALQFDRQAIFTRLFDGLLPDQALRRSLSRAEHRPPALELAVGRTQ